MKTIIAGSRSIEHVDVVAFAVEQSGFTVTEIASGMARGVDTAAIEYAGRMGISLVPFPADWDGRGRSAGYERNVRMAEWGEQLIAVWDGKSRGTKHMIDIAKRAGLRVYVYRYHGTIVNSRMVALMEAFQT